MTQESHFRKGILLAAGTGSRLLPLTRAVNKHLLPVFDKPLVYYPLSVLMLAGIRRIQIIVSPSDREAFARLLEDGRRWGLEISYAVQTRAAGIADALLVSEAFIAGDPIALALGDNLFFGSGFELLLRDVVKRRAGATILACDVQNPGEYGIVELDPQGCPLSLEEKPGQPKSNLAVPGLYIYDEQAVGLARTLTPSSRNELEITDLNRAYLERGELRVQKLGSEITWLDAGTPDSLLRAANIVRDRERERGCKVACPEEIAFRKGWIIAAELVSLAYDVGGDYRDYLLGVAEAGD